MRRRADFGRLTIVLSVTGHGRPGRALEAIQAARRGVAVPTQLIVLGSLPQDLVGGGAVFTPFPLGSAYARNRALELAEADIVAFSDDDLTVDGTWVEAILATFAGRPDLSAVVGSISYEARPASPRLAATDPLRRAVRRRLLSLPAPWSFRVGGNVAFSRAALLELGGFDRAFEVEQNHRSPAELDALLRMVARGAGIARAPRMLANAELGQLLASVDEARAVGRMARRYRRPGIAVGYLGALAAGRQAVGRPLRGLATSLVTTPSPELSPPRFLECVPPELHSFVSGEPRGLGASLRTKTHFLYRISTTSLLHLYVNPSPRLDRALAERETIRRRAAVSGIPQLHAVASGIDSIWTVEELIPGMPPATDEASRWFPAVAEWLVGMAGPPGGPLADSELWRAHAAGLLDRAEGELREPLETALDVVGGLPSRHMHGDLQRRNVLIEGDRIGAIDWEGAWLEGIPGLDLVFLALLARADAPQEELVSQLAQGQDLGWAPLRSRLQAVGVDDCILPPVLLVLLATWALSEERRLQRLGGPPAVPVWGPLFRRHAPPVVEAMARTSSR